MYNNKEKLKTIDEYISKFPPEIHSILQELRIVIKESAPEASEKISYQMPTFFLKKNLVHFAVCKNHIGFYPAASGVEKFRDEFKAEGYEFSKGAVKFPNGQPIPFELVRKIVRFRVEENLRNNS